MAATFFFFSLFLSLSLQRVGKLICLKGYNLAFIGFSLEHVLVVAGMLNSSIANFQPISIGKDR